MSRLICPVCERALKGCLCPLIQKIDNRIELGILQHPTEVSQVKGTAKLAQLSLSACRFWIGEEADQLDDFMVWLNSGEAVFLLYPSIENQLESFQSFSIPQIQREFSSDNIKVLILDGTWRKTHKMMMLSRELRGLNRIILEPKQQSNYQIRKQKNVMSLSTVEAIYETYAQLEGSAEKFKPLITAFEQMQSQQLAYRNKPTTSQEQ